MQQFRALDRADADADREHRQQQRQHVPSACSVSRATTGNSVSSVAPMVQNHDRPRTRQPDRLDRYGVAQQIAQVSASTFRRQAQRSDRRRRTGGMQQAPNKPSNASTTPAALTSAVPVRQQHQAAAGDGAGDDAQEGRRLDDAVAGDQFVFRQLLRQHAVFHRAEQRRLHAEPEQHAEQAGYAARSGRPPRPATISSRLPAACRARMSARLGKPVGEFARCRRQQDRRAR